MRVVKLCRKVGERLYSMALPRESLYSLEYGMNIKAVPIVGTKWILAFDDLVTARWYYDIYTNQMQDVYTAYWAEAELVREIPPKDIAIAETSSICSYWRMGLPDTSWSLRKVPVGTLFCSSIQLTKEIMEKEWRRA